jgi:carbamoyltransferase
MIVLGVHMGHDSSCALVKDGKIVADAQEERFVRVKHSSNVPTLSLGYCLQAAGLTDINDVDGVALGWKNTPRYLRALLGVPDRNGYRQVAQKILSASGVGIGSVSVKPPVYVPNYRLKDPNKVVNVEHHLAHAASAHFTRQSAEKCLVFTIDGAGDNISTAVWQAEGNEITPLAKFHRDTSIGHSYSLVTEALHWWHGDGEGKTMGLAPYGDPEKCRGILDKYFPKVKGPEVATTNGLGQSYYWVESGATQFHFEEAAEVEALCEKYGRENVAAEAQRKLEECILELVYAWVEKTGIRRTAFAGGVFLNVKLNQRIWNGRRDRIIEQHIFPNAGDSGLAVGAALYAYHRTHPFEGTKLDTLYWGPQFSDEYVEALLKERNLEYETVDDPSAAAARMLADGKIVAWFQGRMESGPRALGNRSILMSPTKPENKDIINARVKFREGFRPFCPSILYEKAFEYLRDPREEYFMITSFDVKREHRDKMPAVVHVDGTVRPQMVTRDMNERYWRLIDEFGKRTGVYAVLNTSMNIKGEPMINTPQEAIRCLFDTGLDALVLGRYVLRKPLSFQGTGTTGA